MSDKTNILADANEIINNRSEEKERQYGPMSEGFERAAMIASGMSGKEWNAHDMFIAMTALKLSRQSYNFKTDNLLDCVAYLGAWQNYIDETGDKNNRKESVSTEMNQESSNFEDSIELPKFYGAGETTVDPISPLSGETVRGKSSSSTSFSGNREVDYALASITAPISMPKRRAR